MRVIFLFIYLFWIFFFFFCTITWLWASPAKSKKGKIINLLWAWQPHQHTPEAFSAIKWTGSSPINPIYDSNQSVYKSTKCNDQIRCSVCTQEPLWRKKRKTMDLHWALFMSPPAFLPNSWRRGRRSAALANQKNRRTINSTINVLFIKCIVNNTKSDYYQ